MRQVHLDDHLYEVAKRRAADAGFATVEEYFADLLDGESKNKAENLDHLFTPEVISELDAISARIQAGEKTYTLRKVEEHFEEIHLLNYYHTAQDWQRKLAEDFPESP